MPRGKKFTAEQIIGKLREAEVELARETWVKLKNSPIVHSGNSTT